MSHKKIFSSEAQTVWPEFFLKPKLSKFDLFFDLWPLTFWPMTSTFGDLLAITKMHIGYKFHQDPPMGTWWKVVHWLTHWLTLPLLWVSDATQKDDPPIQFRKKDDLPPPTECRKKWRPSKSCDNLRPSIKFEILIMMMKLLFFGKFGWHNGKNWKRKMILAGICAIEMHIVLSLSRPSSLILHLLEPLKEKNSDPQLNEKKTWLLLLEEKKLWPPQ